MVMCMFFERFMVLEENPIRCIVIFLFPASFLSAKKLLALFFFIFPKKHTRYIFVIGMIVSNFCIALNVIFPGCITIRCSMQLLPHDFSISGTSVYSTQDGADIRLPIYPGSITAVLPLSCITVIWPPLHAIFFIICEGPLINLRYELDRINKSDRARMFFFIVCMRNRIISVKSGMAIMNSIGGFVKPIRNMLLKSGMRYNHKFVTFSRR